MVDHTKMKRNMSLLLTPPTTSELSSDIFFVEKNPKVKSIRIDEGKKVIFESLEVVINLPATSNTS